MPRRSYYSKRRAEERFRDKYYEYLEEACNCHDDSDAEEGSCYYCTRRARIAAEEAAEAAAAAAAADAADRAKPWYDERKTIQKHLAAVAAASDVPTRLECIRALFTAVMAYEAFLAAVPKFRAAVLAKMAEFRADERAASLHSLFDQVEAAFEALAGRADYKA